MNSDLLTPTELAISNGTASAELCREMIRVLRDQIIAHVATVEAAGEYFAIVSAWELRAEADRMLAKATLFAGSAVQTEREVRNANAPKH